MYLKEANEMAENNIEMHEVNIDSPINFTDSAARKVGELIEEEGNPNLMLRVYVTGGGCSGFQYGFTFDETQNPDDTVIEKVISKHIQGEIKAQLSAAGDSMKVCLLIDAMSFQYLAGAEIDYKSDLSGEQFIIRNPHAKTTCGCGSSFSA
jgi:iron-sulfur cluster insertion protein